MFGRNSYSSAHIIHPKSHIICTSCSEHPRKCSIWLSAHSYVITHPLYIIPAYGIDVLNRYLCKVQNHNREAVQSIGQENNKSSEILSDQDYQSTVHIMMYIFPREFGLHNVFTSFVDSRETVQPLKDYTLREEEIASVYGRLSNQNTTARVKLPRRLRGKAIELVSKLRLFHSRCSYDKLLNHYCPASVSSCHILLTSYANEPGFPSE
jgi:hypothetical protein